MKNLILGLVLVLFMVGCSDDDDDNGVSKSELIGKWIWVSSETKVEVSGESETDIDEAIDDTDWIEYLVFKDNGDFEYNDEYVGSAVYVDSEFESGSYKLDGNTITITTDGESEVYNIEIQNGNRLILIQKISWMGINTEFKDIYTKE